jgi:hypothetical protein
MVNPDTINDPHNKFDIEADRCVVSLLLTQYPPRDLKEAAILTAWHISSGTAMFWLVWQARHNSKNLTRCCSMHGKTFALLGMDRSTDSGLTSECIGFFQHVILSETTVRAIWWTVLFGHPQNGPCHLASCRPRTGIRHWIHVKVVKSWARPAWSNLTVHKTETSHFKELWFITLWRNTGGY